MFNSYYGRDAETGQIGVVVPDEMDDDAIEAQVLEAVRLMVKFRLSWLMVVNREVAVD